MLVRYFAAACAAAGVEEEHLDVPDGTTLDGLIAVMLTVDRGIAGAAGSALSLAEVITRSTFLRNEVALRDRGAALSAGDVVDVLPPFAGG
jgi:molybdopterin converting factor small subunit